MEPHIERIRAKLEASIFAEYHKAQTMRSGVWYWIALFYTYVSEIFAALVGAGIVLPFAPQLTAIFSGEQAGTPLNPAGLETAQLVGLVLILALVGLKVYVVQNDLVVRASAVRACLRQFDKIKVLVDPAVQQDEPMAALERIILEHVNPTVDRAVDDGIWPRKEAAPVRARADALNAVQRHGANWKAPTNPEIRG